MALIQRVYDLTRKSLNDTTNASIREAIRYHIEMADDADDSIILSNNLSLPHHYDNIRNRTLANNQINAAQMAFDYGIHDVRYIQYCRDNNIIPYKHKYLDMPTSVNPHPITDESFDIECIFCGEVNCICPRTEEEAHERYLEDLADRDPEYPQ